MKGIFLAIMVGSFTLNGFSQMQIMTEQSPEGKWVIKSVRLEGQLQDVSAKAYEVEFGNDGQMSAKICNRMGGRFTLNGNSISFGPMRSTKMMCQEMNYETAFSRAIMEADTVEFVQNGMILKNGKEIIMVLSMPVNE